MKNPQGDDMFQSGLFSLGLIFPLLFLFIGHVGIGLVFSGVAISVKLKTNSGIAARRSQPMLNWAIAILASSELLLVIGAYLLHADVRVGSGLVKAGLIVLWPISVVLVFLGNGVGRGPLLMGQGLIALWVAIIFLAIWIHGDWSQLMAL